MEKAGLLLDWKEKQMKRKSTPEAPRPKVYGYQDSM